MMTFRRCRIEEDSPRQSKTCVAAVDDAGLRIDLDEDAVTVTRGSGAGRSPNPRAWSDPRNH